MKISLSDIGKRFNRDWIFRQLNFEFQPGTAVAITGTNGSGKSTLLQIIAGATVASEGTVSYELARKAIPGEEIFKKISFSAPYLELIEEMTAEEFLRFHHQFKPFIKGLAQREILQKVGLAGAAKKQIRYFSSGMKQRLRLAQAIFSDSSCLFLDEPCSNLDAEGIDKYHQLISDFNHGRLIIVCSNDPQEYSFCEHRILLSSQ